MKRISLNEARGSSDAWAKLQRDKFDAEQERIIRDRERREALGEVAETAAWISTGTSQELHTVPELKQPADKSPGSLEDQPR